MIVKPRVRGFVCTTAHPVGCELNVQKQVNFVCSEQTINGPKKVLIIGCSTGYGLAARIVSAFSSKAATLGVCFEKPGSIRKPGTAGWYNSVAFHDISKQQGLYAKTINGDAFSNSVKRLAVETIKADLGQVDLVIYSIAAPRRVHPDTQEIYNSVLKPIGKEIAMRGVNTDKGTVEEFNLSAASEKEINDTIAVMGGEDWQMWMDVLQDANVLAPRAKSTAFTYIGEQITWDLYWHGTIGRAKQDLDKRVLDIRENLRPINGDARISVLKAVVTQASSAIPIMPLYLSLLFREMKCDGTNESCIEQIYRLFSECLYNERPRIDEEERFRVDNFELQYHIQKSVADKWNLVDTDNLEELADFRGYKIEFLQLFGFALDDVDYSVEVETDLPIPEMLTVTDDI